MEAGFFADVQALAEYDGRGVKAFRVHPDVEQVPKANVIRKRAATTRTTAKGKYDGTANTAHAAGLLARIRPDRVQIASGHRRRMFETILSATG